MYYNEVSPPTIGTAAAGRTQAVDCKLNPSESVQRVVERLKIHFLSVDLQEKAYCGLFLSPGDHRDGKFVPSASRWMGTNHSRVSLLPSLVCVWQRSQPGLATHVMLTNGTYVCPCVRLHMLFPAQGFGAAHLENPSGGLNDGALISVLTARSHQRARRRPI